MYSLDTLVFDNSFSWARAKTVHYAVEVMPPVDDHTASEVKDMLRDGGVALTHVDGALETLTINT